MPYDENIPAPTQAPPRAAEMEEDSGAAAPGAPTLLLEELIQQATAPEATPTLTPPAEAAAIRAGEAAAAGAAAEEGIAAWHNAVKVTALWINSSHRNAYAAIQGLGWRRITAANDSAFLNMVDMLSHAKQMNVSCNVRIEDDNQIHEVYVW